jgi:hypothetical protein
MGCNLSNPEILYKNVFSDGTGLPDATGTESGFDVLNLIDLKGYTYWSADGHVFPQYITVDYGSSISADALGIFSHNLGTLGLSLSVEAADDDFDSSSGVSITEALAAFIPSDDKAILKTFSSVSARYWRLKIDGALDSDDDNPFMAILMIGARITFPNPTRAPIRLRDERVIGESMRSKTGQHLGSVISYVEQKIEAKIPLSTLTWFDANFIPFWDNHASQSKPFFWAWDIDTFPTLVHWAKFRDRFRMRQPMTVGDYVNELLLQMEAIKEEG